MSVMERNFTRHISNILSGLYILPFISFSSPTNRWTNEGGGDRDEREAEGRQDTPGRQLRHRQESSRGTDVQVHRQQASPQHLPALQSPQSYDQGKTGEVHRDCIVCNWMYTRVVFVPPTLCAPHVSVPGCRLSVDVIT